MKILGIETSCDETAVSIVEAGGDLKDLDFKLLGSALNSQVKIHAGYGGVVPALAKREHQKNLPLILDEALKKADTDLSKIDLITVTVGPGLEPALWAGITFAEELGKKLKIPVIPANHMEGHIASVLFNKTNIEFPALALLISGGHTELVLLTSWGEKEKIGKTQDDAVGEAFDKVGRLLGLSYPGGPQISKLAREAREKNIILEAKFPRPMIHSKDFNFSFSGLKTAVLYYLRDKKEINKLAVAREFEDAVIETLISKTKAAIEKYSPKTLVIGGGVIANKALRENFLKLSKNYPEMKILIPEKSLTTDNATMIAAAGFIEYLRNNKPNRKLKAQGNLDIVS
ncbi:MAG: tRNA (adenosine(37)-N6)-threonylcarbamoyltransferase complex transferase subunit TsaD [Candidatus Zambryskibacteria bacterium RIFCSPHIGHO2_12_FULL_38_34]|uniref:tRNA N6-adenosine threonylcarbamoyltransferase n=1 Tax=Candidatus Zambryskibacteria bacterium RIFCSPLOWO2_12_FULL_39_16 TaxID=1802775 RepID=A0A1G2UU64_9BACT|nr:MAG: tRNA (adenosine(37)-N6)-threonylcarbamoyltransferase complex transferase subunit TsaD [Candidatus Zambryskibacteria bacterium RIFCSPHIGHO2_02_FULL_38_22]OHA97893.1 MAG: tRNA (adenosine(37)-N6)-threonylcarbamoyltransferase complex transferase subunit TsaD [Candidatus Zambryskibacteria bacterium RIFCSPHIGHO2_12_FULL_38_34]OHB09039.1 MAG: tRNA (adenosine(37)-N6)-threonylcarbamoyltransferase complex transferase subunit TsaD [Candidatus Zambryskibacteria bacterium RIFCSPLOWO2_02_FULL_38_13]OH